ISEPARQRSVRQLGAQGRKKNRPPCAVGVGHRGQRLLERRHLLVIDLSQCREIPAVVCQRGVDHLLGGIEVTRTTAGVEKRLALSQWCASSPTRSPRRSPYISSSASATVR